MMSNIKYLFASLLLCAIPNTFGQDFWYPEDDHSYSPQESISQKKCREYSKPVVEEQQFIQLSIDATPFTVDKPKCDQGIHLIVGGEPAKLGEFPFMAALGYRVQDSDPYKWACGGTLISENFVMTAAHCLTSRTLGNPKVARLGDINLYSSEDNASPIDFEIDNHIIHPDYKGSKKYNDIALLRLKHQVAQFTMHIRPACLWTSSDIPDMSTATGWGITEEDHQSDELLKVNLKTYNKSICERTYSRSLTKGFADSMICAGELDGAKDTCQGDSGGPLLVTKDDNQCVFYTVGITSFGVKVCGRNFPAVYTRVSSYIPWIEQIVWP